tara:strand:- start:4751 stop:5503 length:753 start_codon:yes stop_codon:yes gene_type:complete
MNRFPLVSIITVVYNGERHLLQTINSVSNQTYKPIEYLIIDGASTDCTLDIIQDNETKITKWISEPDQGLYDAMNKGIKLAKGELIGMINSDDWFEPNAVEVMVNAFLNNPTKTIFHTNRYDIDTDNTRVIKKFNPSSFKFKYYGMTYHHPSMFIAKKEYNKHLYNIELKALSDYQFVLEAFLQTPQGFFYIDKAIVNYRLEGISAQMKIYNRLAEGYIARRNAEMSLTENLLSLIIRSIYFIFQKYFIK